MSRLPGAAVVEAAATGAVAAATVAAAGTGAVAAAVTGAVAAATGAAVDISACRILVPPISVAGITFPRLMFRIGAAATIRTYGPAAVP